MKKPKGKLFTELDEAKQAQLADWLLSGMKYHQAQELIQKEWGLHTTLSALSAFWYEACEPQLLVRRNERIHMAKQMADEIGREPGCFDSATMDAIKQKAFELAISPDANPKDVKAILTLVLKAKDQDIKTQQLANDSEKLKLEIRKYEDACRAAQVEVQKLREKGTDLTGAERTAILDKVDEILGLKK